MAGQGMDAVPREILRAAYERKPIYLLKIPLHYGLWAGLTWVLYATQHHPFAMPIGVAVSFTIANLIRGLGAAGHDAVHGNLSRSKTVSYLLALLCWSPSGFPVTLYANYHLHHHKITNTYPDVDNVVVTDYTKNPTLAKLFLFCVYTFAYPMYFLGQMMKFYMKRLTLAQQVRTHLETLGYFSLVGLAAWKMPFQVWVFCFLLPFVFGAILASVTSMIEHFEMPATDDDAYSSRTYGTRSHFLNFLWNNVTYHNEHHKYPGIPFYNLKSFHHAAYPYYDDRVKSECYGSVLGPTFMLWGRIVKLDVEKLEAKYEGLDKQKEREKMLAVQGIQPGAA
ncbi:omega-3 fatty acid desaturase [Polyangium spumosum]|uniref:Omega-3 fatty acid desaturase n=2 Tax=Polyangium spumosum TaxID=889282 RepID=A0A6N7Q471_9BACT|nr:omega-3 fatty acid desaturase [Polyangium spumosum]